MYFSKGAVIAMSTTATATTTTTTTATAISTTDGEVTTKTIAVGYSHIDSNRRIYDNNQDITPVVAFERVESIKNGDNNNINDIDSVQHTKDETSIGSFSRPSIIVSTTDHMGSITDAEDRRRRANSLQNLGNHLEETLVHDEEAERLELMMKLRPTLAEEFLKQASVIDLYLLGKYSIIQPLHTLIRVFTINHALLSFRRSIYYCLWHSIHMELWFSCWILGIYFCNVIDVFGLLVFDSLSF